MIIQNVRRISDALVRIETDCGCWQFAGVRNDLIRCTYSQKEPCEEPLIVDSEALKKNSCSLALIAEERDIRISAGKLEAVFSRADGAICWQTEGRVLLQEKGHELAPCDVMRCELDGPEPIIERVKTIDGERNFVKNLREVPDHQAYRAKIYYDWQPDEALYGLGQAEEGFYNYRGKTQYLYQHNMRIPMPVLVSSLGYGILMDCGCLMTFQDNERGSYWFLDAVSQLDYYIMAPGTIREVTALYRLLTGQASMLPRWTFGYMQSKEAYLSDKELLETAEEYRRRNLPISCVIQDWKSWEEGKWGNKHLDPDRYGRMKETHEKLHEMGVHTLISVWPNMSKSCEDYEEMKAAGCILLDRSTYNALDPQARKLYWKQAKEGLWDQGFDGWWCDSTEPFTGADWNGPVLREPWERYEKVGADHKKYLPAEKANTFALHHAHGIYENQRETTSRKRVVNLTRSGYASQQKYGTIVWSGDIAASWQTLRRQIAEGLNMSMSGMPYWTLDIGGFFVVSNQGWRHRGCGGNQNPKPIWFWQGEFDQGTEDPAYRELYTRWLEFGTFLPIMRSHGTDYPREIWQFGEEGTPYYDAIAKFIRLRYELLPYIYSLAGAVTQFGANMMESLIAAFPEDPQVKAIADQYMFGPALLICPVTEPSGYAPQGKQPSGCWKRSCYLPEGCGWRDFWTDQYYEGGQWITAEAPLDRIPVFVRCGSVIPMARGLLRDEDTVTELRICTGADGGFTLYQDAGDGYGYEQGEYALTRIHWEDQARRLTIEDRQGAYPGMKKKMTLSVLSQDIVYDGNKLVIEF